MRSVSDSILILLLTAFILSGNFFIQSAKAASDPRFFGSYCGTHRENISRRDHINFSIEAHADYYESHLGSGLIVGKGKGVLTSHTLSDRSADRHNIRVGSEISFVFTGVVNKPGEVTLSGLAGNRENIEGIATLSGNGMELIVPIMGKNIQISKLQCGNRAPTATITTSEDTFSWGMLNHLAGNLTDDEAEPFPEKRLEWSSKQDSSWKKNGYTATLGDLSPGTHQIVFTVTDYGGLQAKAQKTIYIENTPPGTVQIFTPSNHEEFCAGQRIPFDGWATDMELGNLTDRPGALRWTYGDNIPIATGTPATGLLPLGSHTVTLTASDGSSSTSTSVNVIVRDPSHGNCSPTVVMYKPDNRSVTGNDFIDESDPEDDSEDCIYLLAQAWDLEDGNLSEHIVWKDSTEGVPDKIFHGPRVRACGLYADVGGGDAQHTISATVTDSSGAESSVSRTVYVIPIEGGIY